MEKWRDEKTFATLLRNVVCFDLMSLMPVFPSRRGFSQHRHANAKDSSFCYCSLFNISEKINFVFNYLNFALLFTTRVSRTLPQAGQPLTQ
jgi:hypothetical protein